MKLIFKHKITFDEADRLIERYYEGETSVEEEKRLHTFLAQSRLPEKYAAEQAIFGYFDKRKQKNTFSLQPYLRRVGGAAAAIVIFVAGIQSIGSAQASYAYVDGVKITNIAEVKSRALAELTELSNSNNEVQKSLNDVTNNQLIKQQLEVFSGLGE